MPCVKGMKVQQNLPQLLLLNSTITESTWTCSVALQFARQRGLQGAVKMAQYIFERKLQESKLPAATRRPSALSETPSWTLTIQHLTVWKLQLHNKIVGLQKLSPDCLAPGHINAHFTLTNPVSAPEHKAAPSARS